jgi:hypothetical protein
MNLKATFLIYAGLVVAIGLVGYRRLLDAAK